MSGTQVASYSLMQAFISTRTNPIRDAALLDSAIDRHQMKGNALIELEGRGNYTSERTRLLKDFGLFLRSAGVNSCEDVYHL